MTNSLSLKQSILNRTKAIPLVSPDKAETKVVPNQPDKEPARDTLSLTASKESAHKADRTANDAISLLLG